MAIKDASMAAAGWHDGSCASVLEPRTLSQFLRRETSIFIPSASWEARICEAFLTFCFVLLLLFCRKRMGGSRSFENAMPRGIDVAQGAAPGRTAAEKELNEKEKLELKTKKRR